MPSVSSSKPKYTKNANIGDLVQSNCIHVSVEAQCKCWYGRLWKEKWDTGVPKKIEKKPANSPNQCFYKVEYTLPDGSTKLVPLCDVHCCLGMWTAITTTPAATFGCDMEKDNTFINLLQAPSIKEFVVSSWMNLKEYVIFLLVLTL
jgi:hypothetical protein